MLGPSSLGDRIPEKIVWNVLIYPKRKEREKNSLL